MHIEKYLLLMILCSLLQQNREAYGMEAIVAGALITTPTVYNYRYNRDLKVHKEFQDRMLEQNKKLSLPEERFKPLDQITDTDTENMVRYLDIYLKHFSKNDEFYKIHSWLSEYKKTDSPEYRKEELKEEMLKSYCSLARHYEIINHYYTEPTSAGYIIGIGLLTFFTCYFTLKYDLIQKVSCKITQLNRSSKISAISP